MLDGVLWPRGFVTWSTLWHGKGFPEDSPALDVFLWICSAWTTHGRELCKWFHEVMPQRTGAHKLKLHWTNQGEGGSTALRKDDKEYHPQHNPLTHCVASGRAECPPNTTHRATPKKRNRRGLYLDIKIIYIWIFSWWTWCLVERKGKLTVHIPCVWCEVSLQELV